MQRTKGWLPVVTVNAEGGLYRASRNTSAPIRIYPDRSVYDDILAASDGTDGFRGRLSRKEFSKVRKAARLNDAA